MMRFRGVDMTIQLVSDDLRRVTQLLDLQRKGVQVRVDSLPLPEPVYGGRAEDERFEVILSVEDSLPGSEALDALLDLARKP